MIFFEGLCAMKEWEWSYQIRTVSGVINHWCACQRTILVDIHNVRHRK